jgi:4-hydroxy-2-oxoheptanedioate aldolase
LTETTTPAFKQKMRDGAAQLGVRSQFCSSVVVEALGFCGFDYVYIDMEHSPNSIMMVLEQCQALGATPAQPVVRVPTNDAIVIQQLLDAGVENIVVPMVETAEEARQAVAATRYPPHGTRSAAKYHRGNRYGNLSGYETTIEDRICLVVQIESAAAVSRVAEIAAVDGVDGLLFGPADLAADMGHFGKTEHPEVVAAIQGALGTVIDAGKLAGMSTGDPALARDWVARGCSFVSIAGDIPLLVGQANRALALARGVLSQA